MTPELARSIAAHKVRYRGFEIRVKRDFGDQFHLVDGMPCMWGYVVVYHDADVSRKMTRDGGSYIGCNAMPGATWFGDVAEAKRAIDVLLKVGGEKNHGEFWKIIRKQDAAIKAAIANITKEVA